MSTGAKKKSLIDAIPSDSGWFGTWLLLLAAGNGLTAAMGEKGPLWLVVQLVTILFGAALAFRALEAREKRDRPK